MEKNRKNIDDLFKSELGSYTEAPPPAVWDALEQRLDNTAKPRPPFTRFGYVAIVALLLISGVIAGRYLAGNTNDTDKRVAANDNNTQPAQGTNGSDPATKGVTSNSNNTNTLTTTVNNNDPGTETGNGTTNLPAPANDHQGTDASQASKSVNANGHEKNNNKQNNTAIEKTTTQRPGNNYNGGISATVKGKKNTAHKERQPKYVSAKKKHTKAFTPTNVSTNQAKSANTLAETSTSPQNVYNSSTPQASEPEDRSEQITQQPSNDTTKDRKKDTNNQVADNKKKKLPKPKFTRFEAGIKAGYEAGFDNDAAKKIVATPYLQYKITRKFAIMLQPGIKSSTITGKRVGGATSYYNINNDGTIYPITDSVPVHIIGTNDSFWIWHYYYVQTHDSIVKTYTTAATYIEFELPVLLKYYITKNFSVYGGANMVYSKLIGLTEQTYTSKGIQKMVTESGIGPVNGAAPPPPTGLTSEITYPGTPFSSYKGPQYPVPQGSLLRFGYMLGFSYEYQKWLFDALVQQAPVSASVQGGYNTNTPLSAPYFRLTIGYKLIK